ncbi:NDR1/HIN1-like protein 13 [Curcuma longa]|uniref:NDR1/HIN1-like protein 13 n=1 Tax=Curcuma longa TaxID=136217 RepID=UPI003D9DB4A0
MSEQERARAVPTADASPVPAPKLGSFVVQVAKDQIYRVPPPENAYLVVRYRKRSKARRRSPCFRCLIWILAAAFLLLLLLATAAVALYLILRPASLAFAVQSLSDRGATDPDKTEYDLTLNVTNPSHKLGYSYAAGGSVVLVVVTNGAEIAAGETPGFYQGPRNTTTMPLALRGSNASQPKGASALKLTAKLRARPKVGNLQFWSTRMEVTCGVGASALAGEARILSQHCHTKLLL